MDKRSFQNETAFQVVMHLARRMLAEKLITGKEYRDFVQEMIRRFPGTYTLDNCIKQSDI